MDDMNTFQALWQNWSKRPYSQPDTSEHVWINELNQAVFSALEKNLGPKVKVRTVDRPAFIYHVEAAGGYGVESRSAVVNQMRINLSNDWTFEERVDYAVRQVLRFVQDSKTAFFYTPIVPICADDYGNVPNRRMMVVRMFTTSEETVETVAVKERRDEC